MSWRETWRTSWGPFSFTRSSSSGSNPRDWQKEELRAWLEELEMPFYFHKFERQLRNGKGLFAVTNEELRDDVGVKPLKQRKILVKSLDKLRKGDAQLSFVRAQCEALSVAPAHGQILSFLAAIQTFLGWARSAIICISLAIVIHWKLVTIQSIATPMALFFVALATLCTLYALIRYYQELKMIDDDSVSYDADQRMGPLAMGAFSTVGTAMVLAIVLWPEE